MINVRPLSPRNLSITPLNSTESKVFATVTPIGYPERYYVVPVRYYVVPTFFGVLWVLCIVPMGTVGYCRAAGYYGYCIVPTGTAVVPTGTTGTTVL